jgi:hypothetical protein
MDFRPCRTPVRPVFAAFRQPLRRLVTIKWNARARSGTIHDLKAARAPPKKGTEARTFLKPN